MIPATLSALPAWVVWRYDARPGSAERAKVPYVAVDRRADVWGPAAPRLTYDAATALARSGEFAGVGFVISSGHDVFMLDLDGCRDPATEQLAPWAVPLVDRLASYTEVSPSGTGVKVFFRATKAAVGPAKRVFRAPPGASPIPGVTKRPAAELFARGGYGTVTGVSFGPPVDVRRVDDVDVATVLASLESANDAATTDGGVGAVGARLPVWNDARSDDELEAMIAVEHRTAYHKLWIAGPEDRDDPSKLDAWAASLIARYVGGDPARIARLMRRTALPRPKWDTKRPLRDGTPATYLDRTIEAALLGVAAGRDPTVEAEPTQPVVLTLTKIFAEPDTLRPPDPILPRLAWRGRVTVYAAPDKGGKSTLVAAAVAAATRGQRFLDGPARPPLDVFWALLEEHVADLAARARLAGTDPDRLHVLTVAGPDPIAALRAAVAATEPRPAVVVVDTLIRYAGDRVTEGGASAQWQPVMAALRSLARELDVGVVALHHARKSDGVARDSSEITAAVDVIIEQRQRHEGGVVRATVRGRWALPDLAVRYVPPSPPDRPYYGYELLDDAGALAASEAAFDDVVAEVVRATPGQSTTAIQRAVGRNASDVRAALDRLVAAGRAHCANGSRNAKRWHPKTPTTGDDAPTTDF